MLERQGIKFSESYLNTFFEEFGQEYQAKKEDLIVLPYVSETIKRLSKVHILGLVTGNQERVARKRLAEVALDCYFSCGGFGNETYERSELVELAIIRALDNGWSGERNRIYSIGDTPRDVEAGKIVGVQTIGVATGLYTQNKLVFSRRDYLINNLSELESILK